MGMKEDLATANAMRAHLVDKYAMGDEDAAKAHKRALLFTSSLIIILIGGYCGIRYRGRNKAGNR